MQQPSKPRPRSTACFYATVATVIPVLFLALALQGRVYQDLLKAFRDTVTRDWDEYMERRLPATSRPRLASLLWLTTEAAFAVLMPLYGAGLILVMGALGEITAILVLAQGSAGVLDRVTVEVSAIFLTVAAVAYPAIAFFRATQLLTAPVADGPEAGTPQPGTGTGDTAAPPPQPGQEQAEGEPAPS